MFGLTKRAPAARTARARLAAIGIASAVALGGGLVAAAPASATITSCSAARGVEVWEYSNYGGPCVMFTTTTTSTVGITYSNGDSVFYNAGTAENNYPWWVSLCDYTGGGTPCQSYQPGPYSANLQFKGVGSVYI